MSDRGVPLRRLLVTMGAVAGGAVVGTETLAGTAQAAPATG